jgi:multiple sugar transport system substrate-binding protein
MDSSGKLMTLPINPNIPLLYYRGDLYKGAGLKAPETFAELYDNSKRFHKPPAMYGMVQRGARGPHTVAYDFYPYLYGFGGSIFKDQASGDFTVTLNDAKGKEALDYYKMLAKDAGHPKTASMDQAEVIQAMVTGKAGHIMAVIAAWSQMDDPNKSIVVDKVEVAVPPHGPGAPSSPALGHFVGGIAKNVPDDRKRAAFEFLKWYATGPAQIALAKNGGVPVHAAAYSDPISQERRFRWMKPMSEALPKAVNIYTFPESADVIAVLELGLNRSIAGEITTIEALNGMATEIAKTMTARGYKSGTIDPLR